MIDSWLADSVAELSRVLWRQRRVLERLRYYLRVQDLMLDGDDSEALVMAVDDVHGAIDAVRELEAARQELTFEVAGALGQDRNVSFQQLIAVVPPPFDEMLSEHREAFLRVVVDITSLSLDNREIIERGMRLIDQADAVLELRTSEAAYAAASNVATRVVDNSFLDFLR
jgi:hypothetical protein